MRDGEMIQWENHLLCKQEGQSLNSQDPHKAEPASLRL